MKMPLGGARLSGPGGEGGEFPRSSDPTRHEAFYRAKWVGLATIGAVRSAVRGFELKRFEVQGCPREGGCTSNAASPTAVRPPRGNLSLPLRGMGWV